MPIFIDGWNLLRCASSGINEGNDSLYAAKRLMNCLSDYQLNHNDPIVVAFDSTREYLDIGFSNTNKLSVVATKNADEYIKKMIDAYPERQRRNIRVVSSDNDISYYAKKAYAQTVSSDDFWDKINKDSASRNKER